MLNYRDNLNETVMAVRSLHPTGIITALNDARAEISGLSQKAQLGGLLYAPGASVSGARACMEIVDISEKTITALPMVQRDDLALGATVRLLGSPVKPFRSHHKKRLDAFGRQPRYDISPPLCHAGGSMASDSAPTLGFGSQIATRVTAIDALLPLAEGQRLGVFAGSGVGKSSLLRQIALGSDATSIVWISIGERAREIAELEALAEKRENWTLIAASGHESPALRLRALKTGLQISAVLRAQAERVLVIIDSITRFAEAARELASTQGEAIAPNGWPGSLSQTLSAMLEQIGRTTKGSSSTIASVLVQGSDMDEPLADMMRGLFDGHLVLDRARAERGAHPAIDPLRSVSRSVEQIFDPETIAQTTRARRILSEAQRLTPLIDAGLYVKGQDPESDQILETATALEAWLRTKTPDLISVQAELLTLLGKNQS